MGYMEYNNVWLYKSEFLVLEDIIFYFVLCFFGIENWFDHCILLLLLIWFIKSSTKPAYKDAFVQKLTGVNACTQINHNFKDFLREYNKNKYRLFLANKIILYSGPCCCIFFIYSSWYFFAFSSFCWLKSSSCWKAFRFSKTCTWFEGNRESDMEN